MTDIFTYYSEPYKEALLSPLHSETLGLRRVICLWLFKQQEPGFKCKSAQGQLPPGAWGPTALPLRGPDKENGQARRGPKEGSDFLPSQVCLTVSIYKGNMNTWQKFRRAGGKLHAIAMQPPLSLCWCAPDVSHSPPLLLPPQTSALQKALISLRDGLAPKYSCVLPVNEVVKLWHCFRSDKILCFEAVFLIQ